MRRFIMATIIAVTFLPTVAIAQMPTANDGLGYVNVLEIEKARVCHADEACVQLYDRVIEPLRSVVKLQVQLQDAKRSERNALLDEIIRLADAGKQSADLLMKYRQDRGIIASTR